MKPNCWTVKMKLIFISHILLLSYFSNVCQSAFGKKKNCNILKFAECSDHPGLPMRVLDFRNHVYSKNNRSVEVKFVVDKELSDLTGEINLWKCDSSGAPDTCEYFVKNLKVKQMCDKIPQKKQGWTEFVESIKPEFSCPIKKGTYTATEYLNFDPFKFFPLPLGVWKAKNFVYQKDTMITCLELHLKIFETRE